MKLNAVELRLQDARSHKSGFLAATLGALTFAAAICNGLTATQSTTAPVWPTNGWQTSTPEEQGMDSGQLAALIDFGTKHSLDSLLIVRHGKIVTEAYYAPYTGAIPHAVNSVTKAVISTLTAIAWKEGVLDTPDHKVLDFFDARNIANLSDRKAAVTVQNLLDMTSGFDWTEGLTGFTSPLAMEQSPDWVKFVLDRQMPNAPGEAFYYDSGNAQVLSAILTKLTGTTALNYAKTKLFGPLGIEEVYWRHDPQGNSSGGFGLYLCPRDMAKIGYLYLREGVWEGKQLLPPVWIDKIKHATLDMHAPWEPGLRYSKFFWVLPDQHIYMAVGHHGQVIMVFPELDMVAVTTSRSSYSLSAFASLVTGTVKSDTALTSNPASTEVLADKLLEASTEKPSEIGPASKLSAAISGKVYEFPPNNLDVKSLSLVLTDGRTHYDLETYSRDGTRSVLRFTDPIGLDGRYRTGETSYHGFSYRLEGMPQVKATKGTWQSENTLLIKRLEVGQGEPPEEWTLRFSGGKLNLSVKFSESEEISIQGQAGG
jgi:CubicO group peptidase (beta-lactamase class C family)